MSAGFLPFNFVFVTSGFRRGVNKTRAFGILHRLQLYYSANVTEQPIGSIAKSDLTPDDGTDSMTRKIDKKLPFYSAQNPKRKHVSKFEFHLQ